MQAAGETFEIRDARASDAAAIAAIYADSVAAGDCSMDEQPRPVEAVQRLLEELGDREALLVLEGPAGVVGWARVERYSERAGYRFAAETAVYLARTHVGRGLGSTLKRAVIARARELGYHHLVAKVMADNAAGLEYNLRLGYELVGVQREIGWRDGRWCDVAILQRLL